MVLLAAAALEALACAFAALRMLRTARGAPLGAGAPPPAPGAVTAIVPVLDEAARLGPALDALRASGDVLAQILVVDGGSADATRAVAAAAATRDARVRWIDAPPLPDGWNGKAWNLETGLRAARTPWIVTIDADVRTGPALLERALARAQREELVALSVATRQLLADAGAALLHPAFLTTLVYRAGLPNVASGDPLRVQANGQVFLARRDALLASGAFAAARASRCEDVTCARTLAAHGGRVGFYEGDAAVRMHDSWRDCAANWPRSLSLRDAYVSSRRSAAALAGVLLAQALPLPTLLLALFAGDGTASALAGALVLMRAGVLAGTRRAYVHPPWTYWLSPLADLPALGLIALAAARRTQRWRGRTLVPEHAA